MKEFKLIISPDWQITLSADKVRKLSDIRAGFWWLLNRFGAILLAGFGLLTLYTLAVSREAHSELLYQLTAVTLGLALILIWQLIHAGWRLLPDPPGFLGVLSFALLAVLAWILSPFFISGVDPVLYRQVNTFGSVVTKSIAGLTIIGLVGIYYFINHFAHSQKRLQYGLWLTVGLMTIAALVLLINPTVMNSDTFGIFAAMGVLVFLQTVFQFTKSSLYSLILSMVAMVTILVSNTEQLWQILFAMLATLLIWLWVKLWQDGFQLHLQLKEIIPDIKKSLGGKGKVKGGIAKYEFPLLAVFTLVVLIALAILIWQAPTEAASYMRRLIDFPVQLFATLNWQTILLGNATLVNLRPVSFLHVVLAYQGVVGALAYILLMITAVFTTMRQYGVEQKKSFKGIKVATMFAPAILFLPILGLFINLHIFLIIWWWIMFALVSAAAYLNNRPQVNLSDKFKIGKFDLGKFWQPWAIISLLMLLAIWFAFNANLLNLLNNGTI